MSQYFTRRSAGAANNAEAKNNGATSYSNFVRSYTPAAAQNAPAENQNVASTNVSSVQPAITTASVQQPVKTEPIKDEDVDQNGDANAATRGLGHEHFRKLKEARKRAGLLNKVDKKLKKKRLNARLEKVLKPKNAFLIFNELNLKPEYTIQENVRGPGFPKTYTALLTLDGRTYSGEGLNVSGAKMVAADVALKDWFTRFFRKAEPNTVEITNETSNGEDNKTPAEREPAPWSAVGSYAMHLLFTRWQMDVNAMTSPSSGVPDEPMSTSLTSSVVDGVSGVSAGGSVSSVSSTPKAAKIVSELINYTAAPSPKLPPNPEQCQPLYVFNLAFPNVPFVEAVNEGNAEERFQLQCMINNVKYEAKARNKKDARRLIAVQVLKAFGLQFPAVQPVVTPQAAVKVNPA